jgi:TPR repeat protein
MTLHRAAALALFVLLPAAAAAQTYAPAEEQPGRITLVPMSVELPAGADWIMASRSEMAVTFIRAASADGRSSVASASARIPDKSVRGIKDLAARLQSDLQEKVDPMHFRVVAQEIKADPAAGRSCVRYRQRAQDLRSAGLPAGAAMLVDLNGISCLHPDDGGIVVGASFTERAPANAPAQDGADAAGRFLAGLRYHAPLSGEAWLKLAEQGDANAQTWLARIYLSMNDLKEGLAWLRKAADQGNMEAQALLGLAYFRGRGVDKDAQAAAKWLRPAAEKGYPRAEGLLGHVLLSAEAVRNAEEGVRWLKKAAGDGDAYAQSLLGDFLVSGTAGFGKNDAEGAAWYRKAAQQGDARSRYVLGTMHHFGVGLPQDDAQAQFWLGLSAAQGHADAKKALAQLRQPAAPAAEPAK